MPKTDQTLVTPEAWTEGVGVSASWFKRLPAKPVGSGFRRSRLFANRGDEGDGVRAGGPSFGTTSLAIQSGIE